MSATKAISEKRLMNKRAKNHPNIQLDLEKPVSDSSSTHCRSSVELFSPMRYYDLKRHWTRRIKPHLSDQDAINLHAAAHHGDAAHALSG